MIPRQILRFIHFNQLFFEKNGNGLLSGTNPRMGLEAMSYIARIIEKITPFHHRARKRQKWDLVDRNVNVVLPPFFDDFCISFLFRLISEKWKFSSFFPLLYIFVRFIYQKWNLLFGQQINYQKQNQFLKNKNSYFSGNS